MAEHTFLYIANSHEIGGGNRSLLTIIDSLRLQKAYQAGSVLACTRCDGCGVEKARRTLFHRSP